MITKTIEHPGACPPAKCDTFQFMAKHMGLKVLHPGGLTATDILAHLCGLEKGMTVLDAGCGRGSGAIHLAKKFGCSVVGLDLDPVLLDEATKAAQRTKIEDRVSFRTGDIHSLPFEDASLDGTISQAVLVFTEKERAISEMARVVKPGGFVGIVELAWKRSPPRDVLTSVESTLCSAAANAELHQGWIDLLVGAGLSLKYSELKKLDFSMIRMLQDEGLLPGLRIALKMALDDEARRRIRGFSGLFEETQKYLGYGVYVGRVDQS